MKNKKANYGQDMPGIVVAAIILSTVFLALAAWQYKSFIVTLINKQFILSVSFMVFGIFFLFVGVIGIWSSRFGKLKLRDKVIQQIKIKGNEKILDLGCGRGLLMLELAKKLTTGKATGADIWEGNIEYKNTPEMLRCNAEAEGVSERIEIVTANAMSLPFKNASFDMVVTSLMMHHVTDTGKALDEMLRVLKPGGTLVIADVNAKQYMPLLKSMGVNNLSMHYATRLFLVPARVIIGDKS